MYSVTVEVYSSPGCPTFYSCRPTPYIIDTQYAFLLLRYRSHQFIYSTLFSLDSKFHPITPHTKSETIHAGTFYLHHQTECVKPRPLGSDQ